MNKKLILSELLFRHISTPCFIQSSVGSCLDLPRLMWFILSLFSWLYSACFFVRNSASCISCLPPYTWQKNQSTTVFYGLLLTERLVTGGVHGGIPGALRRGVLGWWNFETGFLERDGRYPQPDAAVGGGSASFHGVHRLWLLDMWILPLWGTTTTLSLTPQGYQHLQLPSLCPLQKGHIVPAWCVQVKYRDLPQQTKRQCPWPPQKHSLIQWPLRNTSLSLLHHRRQSRSPHPSRDC